MSSLKYTVIKNRKQYDEYCDILENLLIKQEDADSSQLQDEVDLLTQLIHFWDNKHGTFKKYHPVELLKSLMIEHNLKSNELANTLNLSKGQISDMLHYRRGFSKDTIRKLSEYFKVSQEAFNRPYNLINASRSRRRTLRHSDKTKVQ